MAHREGVMKNIKGDGKVEVVVQPGHSGIIGSPNLNVCHCPADSSNITIESFNGIGAGVGDLVSVSRKSSGLIKNAAKLLGIPLLGLISGITAGVILSGNLGYRKRIGRHL